MALFGKREKVYEVWGDKPLWKQARARLKDAGIKVMETGYYETEAPLCGCGGYPLCRSDLDQERYQYSWIAQTSGLGNSGLSSDTMLFHHRTVYKIAEMERQFGRHELFRLPDSLLSRHAFRSSDL